MSADRVETGSGSLGGLIGTLATDIQDLLRGEVRLARAELDEKLDHVIAAATSLVGGALVGFAGLVVLLEGCAAALALVIPVWAALLIVGVIIGGVGLLLARSAMSKMSLKTMTPDRAVDDLKKDARLVKEHT